MPSQSESLSHCMVTTTFDLAVFPRVSVIVNVAVYVPLFVYVWLVFQFMLLVVPSP